MKKLLILLFPLMLVLTGIMAGNMENNPAADGTDAQKNGSTITNHPTVNRLRIRVGSSTFTATLLNNATVTAFKARLPVTFSMKELNGNEKYAELPNELPANPSNPGTIQAGDLMLYGSTTLVLFYKSFPTSYSYTKMGRIDNPAGLAAAVGSGSVTVTFELE